jgi:phage gp29-like protein
MEEKDTHLFSQLQTRKNAVLGLEYEIFPYSESAEDKRIRDFIADVISSMQNFDIAILDLLDAIGKGFALSEINWDIQGKTAIIERLNWIHQKRAIFYSNYDAGAWKKSFEMPRIITESEQVKGEEMPPFKLIYHKYKARSGYDTRAGILRTCAWMYLFKNYAIKDWVAFAEVFGMPLRLGKYDTGASKDDKDALISAIQSLGSNAAGIISKNTEIEFIETVKAAAKENIYKALADFSNKEMSKAILGQTATTEGTPGKLGNEKAQDLVRHDLVKADNESLSKTYRGQLICPLVGYNFGWDKPLPWFKFKHEKPEDLKMLSDVYKNLHGINQPISAEHVSERFKIPMPKKGETILEGPSRPFAMKSRIIGTKSAQFTPEQESVEGLLGESVDIASRAMKGLKEPVKKLITEANSLDEIRDKLYSLYSDMDQKDLEELVARAMYIAELYWRETVAE